MKSTINIHLFFAIMVLSFFGCSRNLLDRPVLPMPDLEESSPEVHISCSNTVPSRAVLKLVWKDRVGMDETQRIDLTVYSNGFIQNRYTSLWPLQNGQRSQALSVSRVRKSTVEPALLPMVKTISQDVDADSTTVILENLSGGLVYRFRLVALRGRVWVPGPAVRVEVPICITE